MGGLLARMLSILSKFNTETALTYESFESWAWFSENRPTYGDFEIDFSTPQLHENLKPIRLLTSQTKT